MQSYSYCHEFDFSFHQNKSIILMYILNLNNTLSENRAGKSISSIKMMKSGYPVLEGFVILSNAFDHFAENKTELSPDFLNELETELKPLVPKIHGS
jgi:phosphoenolpyruvate synthase/pyruvate phosphate dikinase